MITSKDIEGLLSRGGTVVGQGGDKIGKVGQVYLDDQTGEPEWVTVNTGMFGGGESFVPLEHASVAGSEVTVPYDKAKVKDAPRVDQDGDGHISEKQEAELYQYYGLKQAAPAPKSDATDRAKNAVGQDTSGPNTDDAMTRSEEQLKVGTEKVAAGKARLRKFVVTENVTTTVPVTREEVRVVREPITDANRDAAMAGGDLTSEEHEVTLTEERVVVEKEVVPVERVRLDKETVTEQQQVTEEVRKEQIETDTSDVDAGQRKRK
jgi:uncharacterized protein (TIGR02271 family)